MTTLDSIFIVGVLIAFTFGVRSTWRLWRRYRDAAPVLVEWRERLVLGSIVFVAFAITGAAAYFAFLAVRRLLGYEALDWSPYASSAVAIFVLLIPTYLERIVARVARR